MAYVKGSGKHKKVDSGWNVGNSNSFETARNEIVRRKIENGGGGNPLKGIRSQYQSQGNPLNEGYRQSGQTPYDGKSFRDDNDKLGLRVDNPLVDGYRYGAGQNPYDSNSARDNTLAHFDRLGGVFNKTGDHPLRKILERYRQGAGGSGLRPLPIKPVPPKPLENARMSETLLRYLQGMFNGGF